MRIQHNVMSMNAYRNYGNNTTSLSKNLEKLSSGYRINRAGDDAAGLAISEKMRAQLAGLKQAQRNVKDGIGLVQTAEGALQEVTDMVNRMKTLATQAANSTYSAADRTNLQAEVSALLSEIERISVNANFNGIKLLNGSLKGSKGKLLIGASGSETLQVVVATMNTSKLSLAGSKSSITNQSKAIAALGNISKALAKIAAERGKLGAVQNRLEHTSNNLGVMHENIQEAESSIRDTDIADEMSAYTKNNILIQSAQAMLAQANQVPQGVLQLLQ